MKKSHVIYKALYRGIEILIESAYLLKDIYNKGDYRKFDILYKFSVELLNVIHFKILSIKGHSNLELSIESIIDSVNRIGLLKKSRSNNLNQKIEFEYIPLMKDLNLNLYFLIDDFTNSINDEKLFINEYIEKYRLNNKYKYELSIIIIGYNKLEYTKLCVESLFKYIPEKINYELILVNHGSTDGTKEYFESISPTKQLDIFKNGGGLFSVNRIVEGKYTLLISNDVLITKNSIENMLECIESDENIAWVVPTTPNVSNLQTIKANYSSIEEMYNFSSGNNHSNRYKWEQRVRLCNPIDLKRSSVFFSNEGIKIDKYIAGKNNFLFPDDTISLLLRRNGYKMILAKDSYCHHFGSITIKDEVKKDEEVEYYRNGRVKFEDKFGIDPWANGFCYEKYLFDYLKCNNKESVAILGINPGIGANILKVKEQIKENTHNLDVKIYSLTDEDNYILDLKGISDYVNLIKKESDIEKLFCKYKFDYIFFENNVSNYNMEELIIKLKSSLSKNGFLCVFNFNFKDSIELSFESERMGKWYIFNKKR